jgi:two-component system phosphate regulon sensor histidine kinase PhoR
MKNLTPFQLAILNSTIISLMVSVIYLLFVVILTSSAWYMILIVFASTWLISYFVFSYTLEVFIYRKIKIIYKSIHNLKFQQDEPPMTINLKDDIIKEINTEVVEWARSKNIEVAQLKNTETFRREFLGNVSHELKTPIFNIQGYVHTLIDGGLHDEEINLKYLEKAAKNLDNLSNIVSDLEIISKLESGELPLNMSKFDICQLTQEVIDSLEMIASRHNISMSLKDTASQNIQVYADKEKIKQVLTNLISNSLKYGSENGRTLIGFYDMHENILIEISDNGPGIAQEHLPRLFERFYRIDKARSRQEGGSGLGLAIVKHIIEAHEQHINVRSTLNVGTTFGFTLKKA